MTKIIKLVIIQEQKGALAFDLNWMGELTWVFFLGKKINFASFLASTAYVYQLQISFLQCHFVNIDSKTKVSQSSVRIPFLVPCQQIFSKNKTLFEDLWKFLQGVLLNRMGKVTDFFPAGLLGHANLKCCYMWL